MRQREVDALLSQIKEREDSVRPAISFEVGDTVKVADGPFQSQKRASLRKSTPSAASSVFP